MDLSSDESAVQYLTPEDSGIQERRDVMTEHNLEQEKYLVTVGEEEKWYPSGTTLEEIAGDHEHTADAPIILALADGKLQELHQRLRKNCRISFVTTKDHAGYKTLVRTACLILLKAIHDICVKENTAAEKVVLHYSMGPGYYFTIRFEDGGERLNQEFLDKIKNRMRELVDADLPIRKVTLDVEDAMARFHAHRMYDKEKLFRYRRVSTVNVYRLEKFEDYFYGYMATRTAVLQYFDLLLYDEGLVLLLPAQNSPDRLSPFVPLKKIFQVQKESQKWAERLGIETVGDLNDRIIRDGIHHTILIQEALQESRIAEIANEIVRAGGKKFVMIAGPSSSGKTTFSHRLSIQLEARGMRPHPIALDNYFLNRVNAPLDENGEKNYECLEALDVELFNQNMLDLLQGKEVELPVYNFLTGCREYRGDYLKLGPEDVLVIEGIHGLNDRLSHSLPRESKYKIYISALTQLNIDEHNRIPTTDGRLIRRIVRDARTRGTSARETIARWPSVRRGEEENIFPFQEEADIMFNSALIYELACLKVYAEPLLFGIPREAPEYVEAKRLLKFLDYFISVPGEDVPQNSILREFIGGSCFHV